MKLEELQKKTKELAAQRGRKGVDKGDLFRQFDALLKVGSLTPSLSAGVGRSYVCTFTL